MKKILVINGPNLNLLGLREPAIYGSRNFKALEAFILENGLDLGFQIELFQSNHEGAIVDKIQQAYGVFDGIIINPAAYTHTSVAILDALKAVSIPTVEVHLSDVDSREEFRRHSFVSLYAEKVIKGKGFDGYREALEHFSKKN
jgi:3-dehydroquinate dehydratase-2